MKTVHILDKSPRVVPAEQAATTATNAHTGKPHLSEKIDSS